MAQTRINNDNIQENTIQPAKLSTGAPTWDASSNLNVAGDLTVTGNINNSGAGLTGVYKSGQTISEYVTATGFQGDAERLTGNFKGNVSQSTGINTDTYNWGFTRFSQVTGGTVFGNLTVFGGISALSGITVIQSTTTGVSSLSVVNTGLGPALYVRQAGIHDIAVFEDAEGGPILHVNNVNPILGAPGAIGILTQDPTETLTVKGSISASTVIYAGSSVRVFGDIVSTGTISSANVFTSAGQVKPLSGTRGIVVNNSSSTTVLSADTSFISSQIQVNAIDLQPYAAFASMWG